MGRILKIVGMVVGAVVVLLIVAVVFIASTVDPNDYKDQITDAVADATGRTLTLEGDLELKLFPRLGITMGGAEMSNADGFGNEPFARISGAELRVGLLPLLFRRVEIDNASLSGLRLNLARNAAGVNNWDDLAQGGGAQEGVPEPAAETSGEEAGGADVDISVGAVNIADAEVTWRDATTGDDWRLSNFNFEASGFDPGRPFDLEIGFDLAGNAMTVTVAAEMEALVSLADNSYRLDDLSVELEGEGEGWPTGSGDASLAFESFAANLDNQTLQLDGLELDMLGISVSGNLTGENLMDNLSLAGGIVIDDFDPRYLMSLFDVEIETADPDVLKRASASAQFYFNGAGMGMREMAFRLDDSVLEGSAGLRGESVEFDLAVNSINIDRYLPPAAEEEAGDTDVGSVDEVDLPLDPLRNFVADGNLAFGEARFMGLLFDNANFKLDAGNGRMTLAPTGGLYGGTIDSAVDIALQGEAARLAVRADIEGVNMADLARDYLQMDNLAGTGNVNLDLAAVGTKVGEIKENLDGSASIVMTDGALLGTDIWHALMSARARVTGPDAPAAPADPRTTFDRIAIVGPVENALLTTSEFAAQLPWAGLSGNGTIHLLTLALDLEARAGLVDGPVLQQDPVLAEYAGRQVPLTITGTLDSPRVLPDVGAMLSAAFQREVEDEVDAELEEARDEVEDRLRDRLRDALD